MLYWDAVRLWNLEVSNVAEYCNPRKNTKEYYEVLELMASKKKPPPYLPNKAKKKKNKAQAGSSASPAPPPPPVHIHNARGAGRPKGAKNKPKPPPAL